KRAAPFGICPVFGARVSAPVAPQQSRILRTSVRIRSCLFINPFQRGHFYFGLTESTGQW
ncbi:MAG: hypothetical protein MUO64_17560, partial [Anaerolineales bacterium]|nr:hypothetical protein [Anaerolineales bacterium]